MATRRHLNSRIDAHLYTVLEVVARDERRTVPQVAERLIEEGLRYRGTRQEKQAHRPGSELAPLGGAFGWLGVEPDPYDDTHGEAISWPSAHHDQGDKCATLPAFGLPESD